MDEKQRFSNFLVVSALIIWGWFVFVAPQLAPPKKPVEKNQEQADVDESAETEEKVDVAGKDDAGKKSEVAAAKVVKLKEFPHLDDVEIGSGDQSGEYRLLVKFDSQGAVISEVQLTDERYHDLSKQRLPLKVLQIDPLEPALTVKTLQVDIPEVNKELKPFKRTLGDVDWELVADEKKEDSVTWRYVTPDDGLAIQKRFWVEKADKAQANEFKAYNIGFELTLTNRGEKERSVHYVLTGPVGVVLENRYYAQKTRDLAMGVIQNSGAVVSKLLTPVQLQQNIDKDANVDSFASLKYAGIDSQYFAALLQPEIDLSKEQYFLESARPIFADETPANPKSSARTRNVTVQFKSVELDLPAAKAPGKDGKSDESASVKHEFRLFTGPKRVDLLRPMNAENILEYGIAGRLGIPQLLLGLLSIFNAGLSFLPWSYGWAIILLTITVRSCMFPLSRKQALMAAKMQELQPELVALKEKYKAAPEKFAQAQMELFSRHKCNPLSGCLWALVQLPIFFGLYQAFTISVEMRGAPFLWVNNLAAPDALFNFPFNIPLLGPSFNLLPVFTVCLFLVQQKFMMPPATTPEQAMQYKMFFYMTIGMGLMFYSVPAGMCVYFIASSLWGLAERKLLPKPKPGGAAGTSVVTISPQSKSPFSTKVVKNPGRG